MARLGCDLTQGLCWYYDSSSGQYTQQDPIGLYGGVLLEQYVHDPVGWSDTLGLVSWADLKPTGVGQYLIPKIHASKFPDLNDMGHPTKAPTWYPNNTANTGVLHQDFHNKLTEAGVPRCGAFTGTPDELITKSKADYSSYDQKRYC